MEFKEKFFDITNLIQKEFDRNLGMYGAKIKCGRGCSECCSQIFSITTLDAYIIQEHIRSLPSERQSQLEQKAKEYTRKKSLSTGSNLKIPCPSLGAEGECTIYEARPVICRRFGMPIYDYKNPSNIHACHLNFKDGEEIVDADLIPNQTAIGVKWDELKELFNNQNSDVKTQVKTTIAGAILSAFS
jgi:Fe-S-cluster containining protein